MANKTVRRNDADREQWVNNDETLYLWQRRSKQSMRDFIRANRAEIDRVIDRALNRKPIN